MTYRIESTFSFDGETKHNTYIATEIAFGKSDGLRTLKFKRDGKKCFKHLHIEALPYWKKEFGMAGEIVVTNAETGEHLHTFKF